MKIKKGKGNKREQARRRYERLKTRPARWEKAVELIDGNISHYPVAFCRPHGGYLTQGIADTHRCKERNCPGYKEVGKDGKEKPRLSS